MARAAEDSGEYAEEVTASTLAEAVPISREYRMQRALASRTSTGETAAVLSVLQ